MPPGTLKPSREAASKAWLIWIGPKLAGACAGVLRFII